MKLRITNEQFATRKGKFPKKNEIDILKKRQIKENMHKNSTKIIKHLRENSRKSLAAIAKEEQLATSTVFEHVHNLQKEHITKNTIFLNNHKLGYPFRTILHLTTNNEEQLLKELQQCQNTNNIYLLSKDKIMADMLFQSLQKQQEIIEELEKKGHIIENKHDIIETITEETWIPEE